MTNLPPERPFPWALLILGLLIGVIGGLYYAWFLNPVSFEDVPPSELNTVDRERYVLLISEAYLQDGDLTRARERLAALGVSDPAAFVAAQADDAFLSGAEPDMIRALASLAEALGA